MPDDRRIMFLDLAEFDDGKAIRGAFLTTDLDTKPREFRCSSPVRPSALQRILYGAQLEAAVAIDLIGKPLLDAAREQPSVILVRRTMLLELAEHTMAPVFWLGKDIEDASASSGLEQGHRDMITSDSGYFEPVVIRSNCKEEQRYKTAYEMLTAVFEKRNLLEPFERIYQALIEVHNNQRQEAT